MFRRAIAPLLLVVLGATACGAESELETATAIAFAERFPTAGDAAAACVASGYLDHFGSDLLRSQGFDPSTLATDPASLDGLIGRSPDVVAECVNLEERLAGSLDTIDGELEVDCVEVHRLGAWPLVRVLLEQDGDLAALSGRAETQLLDAVRGCVDEPTFAALAGLDDPGALAEVLVADPFAPSRWIGDQDRCVVSAVLETLGIERLDELGVGLERPDALSALDELRDIEVDRVVAASGPCDLLRQLIRAISVTEPHVAPCVMEQVRPDAFALLAAEVFRGERILDDRSLSTALDTCVTEALDGLYPMASEPSVEVELFVADFVDAFAESSPTEPGEYQDRCLEAGLLATTDENEIATIERVFTAYDAGRVPSLDDEYGYHDYMLGATEVVSTCVEPWNRLLEDLVLAEIDADTLPCVRAELDPSRLRAITDSFGPAIWSDDDTAWLRVQRGFAEVAEAIEACGPGQDLQRWNRYLDQLFDPTWTELEPVLHRHRG